MTFNRERFIIRMIAGVIIAQITMYGFGSVVCSFRFASSTASLTQGACQPLQTNLNRSVEIALNILLALLGAGAIAVSATSPSKSSSRKETPLPAEPDPVAMPPVLSSRPIPPPPTPMPAPTDHDPRF